MKNIKILNHARRRMQTYNVSEELVREAIDRPDSELESYGNRRIAQKKLGRYVLRIIYEYEGEEKIVVTVYKARAERYDL